MAWPCAGGKPACATVVKPGTFCRPCKVALQEKDPEERPSRVPPGRAPSMLVIIRRQKRMLHEHGKRLERALFEVNERGIPINRGFNPLWTEQLKETAKALSDLERSERQYRTWAAEDANRMSLAERADAFADWFASKLEGNQQVDLLQKLTRIVNDKRGQGAA